MEVQGEWEDLFPRTAEKELQRKQAALDFAKLYLVFEQDPRARQIYAHWVKEIEQRDLTPTTTHSEFAYWESRRAFVRGIGRQLELAKNPDFGFPGEAPRAV